MDLSRLGLATFLHPQLGLPQWLGLARELGLGWVELRADPGVAYAGELSPRERQQRRQRLEEAGLNVSLHVPIHGVNPASPNPRLAAASLAEYADAISLAGDLGARLVVLHPGGIPGEYAALPQELEQAWRRLEFALEFLLPLARRHRVTLALENKQRGGGRDLILTPEEHLRALERFPELGACLDFGHLATLQGDPAAYVEALGARLLHVHLHDNHGQRDEHLGLGQGLVRWREALEALERAKYRGAVILEIPDPEELCESVKLLSR
jgi:sugar phosphate isomerase/epimerase